MWHLPLQENRNAIRAGITKCVLGQAANTNCDTNPTLKILRVYSGDFQVLLLIGTMALKTKALLWALAQ